MKKLRRSKIAVWLLAWMFILTMIPGQKIMAAPLPIGTGPVVIYEAYGGGGNTGAHYKNDFIVLKNISDKEVDLNGWAVQYASKTGEFTGIAALSGTLASDEYYIIKAAAGSSTTAVDLPEFDLESSINMSGTTFKLALTKDTVLIKDTTVTETTLVNFPGIVDYLGVGPEATGYLGTAAAPILTNTTSAIRNELPNPYTGNNSVDFITHVPDFAFLSEAEEPVVVPLTVLEARAASGEVTTKGIVTFIDGKNVVIQDDTAGINCFLKAIDPEIKLGMELTVKGTRSAFNGLEQIGISTLEKGAVKSLPAPKLVSMAMLTDPVQAEALESQRIHIKGATLGALAGSNLPISKDGKSINIYKPPGFTGIVAGNVVDVTAVMSQYNTTYQLRVAKAEDVALHVEIADPITDEMTTGISDLKEVYALVDDVVTTTVGQVAYTFAGNTVILQDVIDGEVIGLQIYDYANFSKYVIGDIVKVTGTTDIYGGVMQIKTVTSLEVIGKDTPFLAQEVTANELLNSADQYLSEFVVVRDAVLGTYDGAKTTLITDSTGTIGIYKGAGFPAGVLAGDKVDVYAAASKYTTTRQLRVGLSTDYVLKNDTDGPVITVPTFLPAKAGKDYTVAIDATDNVGVKLVSMVYEINGVKSESLPMVKNETTGKYQAVIPGAKLMGTTEVSVIFTAVDVNDIPSTKTVKIAVEDKPMILSVTPSANSSTGEDKKPVITVTFENAGENPIVMLTLNDNEPVKMTVTGNTATYTMTTPMVDGKVSASVVITRTDAVVSDPYEWSFHIGEPLYNFYYGQLHAHTNYSDGSGTPDQALAYAKAAAQIDFLALTDHSNYFDSTTSLGTFDNANSGLVSSENAAMSKWAYYKSLFDKHTTDDFLALYGFEMTWSGQYGHINTFNSDGFVSRNNSLLSAKGGSGLQAYYNLLKTQEGTFSQFNHPGTTFGTFEDFGYYDRLVDQKINLIEVGNGEGPVGGSGYFPSYEYYSQALDKGWHLAPSNGQDNHKGKWGDANTTRTVVIADALDKTSLTDAIGDMMVYATEDNNFEIFYTANGMPMGTIFKESPEKLDILVDFNDPDSTDVIGKVKVIVNGGIVAHTESINSNAGKLEVSLPNDYSYYYVMVEQGDGDIAVSAPVWTGEVTQVGINELTKDTSMDVMGEVTKLTTQMYNYESEDFTLTKVEYLLDGAVLETKTENLPVILKGTEGNVLFDFTPKKVGKQTITVNIEGKLNGVSMAFTKSIVLNVYDNNNVVDILVDAAHDNFYVAGDYANNDTYFTAVAGQKGARVKRVNDVITAASLEGIELLMLTVPYKGFGQVPKNYTEAEIEAIRDYTAKGGNIILTSKSDRGNAGGESNAATISNRILEAVGAKARIADGIVVDNERKSNEAYRIQFTEDGNFNEDSMFGKGILTETIKTFNAYNSAPVILNGATPIVTGYSTTWGANYTEDFTGSSYVPDYATDKVTAEKGKVHLVAEEMLPGGGFLVTAGVTFFSNFEVTVEMLIEESVRNANFMILNNVIDEIKPDPVITSIADVQKAEEGLQFTIRGRLTSNVSGFDKSTAFFDSAYIQDETGGINIFPIDGNYEAGTMLELTGITSSYQGEHQLNISSVKAVDEPNEKVVPKMMATAQVSENLGLLVQVKGIVRDIIFVEGVVEAIILEDESGVPVRVFIDGYIGTEVIMPEMEIGDWVSAIGLSSIDPLGTRIRVRDRKEVTLVADAPDKTELEKAILEAEEISLEGMTEESSEALLEAIEIAKSIMEDDFATQTEIDEAVKMIEAAVDALEVKVEETYTLKDEKTGVTVVVPMNAFTEKPVLVVKQVSYKLAGHKTNAYEVHFLIQGKEVLPSVDVTLMLPIGNLDGKIIKLFHEKDDRKLEKMNFKVVGKYVETRTRDFSVFVLANETGKFPATGEGSNGIPMVLGMLLLTGGVLMVTDRRKKLLN